MTSVDPRGRCRTVVVVSALISPTKTSYSAKMTRLVCLAAGSLLLALSLCQLETAEAIPQLSPEVKKISILDLFQEEPSLKAELEARLIEKGKKPVPVSGGGTPREAKSEALPATTTTTTSTTTTTTTTAAPEASTTTAASEDKQSPRALRTRGRPSRTSGPESAVAVADDTEPAATEEGATTTTIDAEAPGAAGGPARKLRPQRLTLRRQRPGQAVAASATTEGSAAGDLPEPELEEGLVKTLVEGSEAEGGPEAKEEVEAEPAVPTKKPRARFSLPPRNGAGTAGGAPANKKVEEAPAAEEKAGSGLDRLRNARIGGGRFRNSGGRQAPAATAAADEASPAATADDASAKPLNRLSLAERRSRFSNARTPPTAAAEEAGPQEEETAAAADEAAAEEAPAGATRKNARRFPTLARRNS